MYENHVRPYHRQADGRGYSTIHSVRGVVRPAFQMAVDDDLIRKNPFEFQLCTVVVNDSVTREAITRKQERKFLEFIKNDEHYKRYYDGMFILFKTGLRISEFCGLTLSDIDFEEKQISVNHQLQRTRDMKYVIEDTKTSSGTRIIPMTEEVYECFKRIVENRKKPKKEPVIDGYKGFLFLDKKDMPEVALHWEKHFEWALAKHNRIYKEQLPKITPHVCRHQNLSSLDVTKDYEEFTNAGSIFAVYKRITEDNCPAEINLESNKIRIGLGTKDYDVYAVYSGKTELQSLFHSMLILPALVYVFEELRQEGGEETYHNKEWFLALEKSYAKRGITFMEEVLNPEKTSYQLAQEAMELPLSKAFDQIPIFFDTTEDL